MDDLQRPWDRIQDVRLAALFAALAFVSFGSPGVTVALLEHRVSLHAYVKTGVDWPSVARALAGTFALHAGFFVVVAHALRVYGRRSNRSVKRQAERGLLHAVMYLVPPTLVNLILIENPGAAALAAIVTLGAIVIVSPILAAMFLFGPLVLFIRAVWQRDELANDHTPAGLPLEIVGGLVALVLIPVLMTMRRMPPPVHIQRAGEAAHARLLQCTVEPDATSVRFLWRTDPAVACSLELRPHGNPRAAVRYPTTSKDVMHSSTVDGLQPDTAYEYAVFVHVPDGSSVMLTRRPMRTERATSSHPTTPR